MLKESLCWKGCKKIIILFSKYKFESYAKVWIKEMFCSNWHQHRPTPTPNCQTCVRWITVGGRIFRWQYHFVHHENCLFWQKGPNQWYFLTLCRAGNSANLVFFPEYSRGGFSASFWWVSGCYIIDEPQGIYIIFLYQCLFMTSRVLGI